MKYLAVILLLLCPCLSTAAEWTPVPLQDFEKESSLPKLWVVNIPADAASVALSTDQPHGGRQCLKLDYRFTGEAQYLGVANRVRILAPVHKLHFWVRSDGSDAGLAVYLTDVSGERHKYRTSTLLRNFTGWKQVDIDLDGWHETWGGDKNRKIDYPVTAITLEVGNRGKGTTAGEIAFDDITVESEKTAIDTLGVTIAVQSPAYCSDVKGDTKVDFTAPGFATVTAKCWKQGDGFGSLATIAEAKVDEKGAGSFVFPADAFPHGPVTLELSGETNSVKDTCCLQLYNRGGVSWKEGMPKDPPSPAKGMALVFADDFDKPLSISSTDPKATYFDHKPLGGDFSSLPFTGHPGKGDPFLQVDTYLRIRADEKKNSAGLISSLFNDDHGIKAAAPCYFECRFVGPNAIGTWPAFWLLTDYPSARKNGTPEKEIAADELDIIEAYGGEGLGSPNSFDRFQITPHAWNQSKTARDAATKAYADLHNPASLKKAGIPSTWYETFHTYGCKITETDTIYYVDDIEVGRHKTLEVSKKQPFFFLINLATGGGWPVDLSRYDGRADMYVDYVRVYQGPSGDSR
jgi:hypothetical protein